MQSFKKNLLISISNRYLDILKGIAISVFVHYAMPLRRESAQHTFRYTKYFNKK